MRRRLERLGRLDVRRLNLRRLNLRWRCRGPGLLEGALLGDWCDLLRRGHGPGLFERTLLRCRLCSRRDLLLERSLLRHRGSLLLLLQARPLERSLLWRLLLGRELRSAGVLLATGLLDLLERAWLKGRAWGGLAVWGSSRGWGQVHLAGGEGAYS